jgi:catechol 2,3-dioxygenase-like lactoylglutathione lyase family enzyme
MKLATTRQRPTCQRARCAGGGGDQGHRKFYEDILGLKVAKTDPSPGVLYESGGGTKLYLYKRGATKAEHTTAAFAVADVEAEVDELKAKGVTFQEIDAPGIKTVAGVATMGDMKGAWFNDTEGNILAITNLAA